MKSKRILISIVSPGFELMNRYSAVASVIYSFADLLRKNGNEIYVNQFKLEEWEKIKPSSIHSTIVKSKLHLIFPSRIRELVKDLMLLKKNKKLFNEIAANPRPDVIISWVTYGNSYSIDLGNSWKVPVIAIFDNPLAEEYTYLKGFPPFIKSKIDREEKRSVKEAKAVIVYSHAVMNYLKTKHGVENNFFFKAFTDFKRMDYLHLQRDVSVINFVYIGSFFNWHKIEDLTAAFDEVNAQFKNCHLYLVGDGPEYNRIHAGIKNPNVTLTGKLDGKSLSELIQKMHIGVISNALWFHAPVKFFQYSAAQLAVICKKTPTIGELAENKPNYLFFETKEELVSHMTHLLNKPQQIYSAGLAAREHIEKNFSESAYSDFLNTVIQSVEA